MRFKGLTFILASLLIVASVGCAEHWREADAGVEPNDLFAMISEVQSSSGETSEMTEFVNIAKDSQSAIYFAEAPGTLGTVASIASLVEFDFLGPDFQGVLHFDISNVRIFLVDNRQFGTARRMGLLIDIQLHGNDQRLSRAFMSNEIQLYEKELVAIMGDAETDLFTLSTYDLESDSDELMSVVQLVVSKFNNDGLEERVGKFSTLVGFGP